MRVTGIKFNENKKTYGTQNQVHESSTKKMSNHENQVLIRKICGFCTVTGIHGSVKIEQLFNKQKHRPIGTLEPIALNQSHKNHKSGKIQGRTKLNEK